MKIQNVYLAIKNSNLSCILGLMQILGKHVAYICKNAVNAGPTKQSHAD
jgi:hypothetical protein